MSAYTPRATLPGIVKRPGKKSTSAFTITRHGSTVNHCNRVISRDALFEADPEPHRWRCAAIDWVLCPSCNHLEEEKVYLI